MQIWLATNLKKVSIELLIDLSNSVNFQVFSENSEFVFRDLFQCYFSRG